MSRLRRVAAAAGRCVVWLLPIGRGEWAEALWTEADAVPPGRPRLAWRAGGLRLVTGEILTWRRVGRVHLLMCLAFPVIGLFMGAMAAAAVVWGSASAAGQGGPPGGGGPGPAPDQPDGGRRAAADGGAERLTADPFPGPGRDDDEDRSDLVGAAGGAL